jgi:hypothetical protein
MKRRKETPRQRILRAREQYKKLNEDYEIWVKCPPSFCNFCQGFWFERGLEECDWGCNFNSKRFDAREGDVTACRNFKPQKDWKVGVEGFLNQCLWETIDKLWPKYKTLKSLQDEIKTMTTRKSLLEEELRRLIRFSHERTGKANSGGDFCPNDRKREVVKMSYCRWSSDNWHCDLYCYEDTDGGITTHVADNRIVGDIPKANLYETLLDSEKVVDQVMDRLTERKIKDYMEAQQRQSKFLRTCKHKKIGLPHDGETFNDPDYESFLERLLHLREVGYKFPDYVIKTVKEDIEDAKNSNG